MDNTMYESLNDYFATISKLGHVTDDDTYGLLIFSFLTDLLNGYKEYVSKEDYYLFSQATLQLYGKDYLIPYNSYIENINPTVNIPSVEINDSVYKLYILTKQLSDNITKINSTLEEHASTLINNTDNISSTIDRINAIEDTSVIQNNQEVDIISDIVIE